MFILRSASELALASWTCRKAMIESIQCYPLSGQGVKVDPQEVLGRS